MPPSAEGSRTRSLNNNINHNDNSKRTISPFYAPDILVDGKRLFFQKPDKINKFYEQSFDNLGDVHADPEDRIQKFNVSVPDYAIETYNCFKGRGVRNRHDSFVLPKHLDICEVVVELRANTTRVEISNIKPELLASKNTKFTSYTSLTNQTRLVVVRGFRSIQRTINLSDDNLEGEFTVMSFKFRTDKSSLDITLQIAAKDSISKVKVEMEDIIFEMKIYR